MIAKKQRSKKRSDASSKSQPDKLVLFLDRNLGKHIIAEALRSAGHPVEIHDDHLPLDAPDEDWIKLISSRGWIGVTKDKRIRTINLHRPHPGNQVKHNAVKLVLEKLTRAKLL